MAAKDRAFKAAAVKIPAHVQREGKGRPSAKKSAEAERKGCRTSGNTYAVPSLSCASAIPTELARARRGDEREREVKRFGEATDSAQTRALGRRQSSLRYKTARYKTQMRNPFFGYQFYLACCIDAAVSFMLTQKLAEHGEVALRILEQGVVRSAAERLKAGIWQRAPAGHALLRAKVELTT